MALYRYCIKMFRKSYRNIERDDHRSRILIKEHSKYHSLQCNVTSLMPACAQLNQILYP